MTLVNSYEEISELIGEQLCRGMICNSVPSFEVLKNEIEQKSLFYYLWDTGLAIIRRRKTHDILNYYIKDIDIPFDGIFERDTVVEIPQKPKSDASQAVDFWRKLGFCEILSRVRLTKPKTEEKYNSDYISYAKTEDARIIKEIFSQSFSALTGCLPTEKILENNIENSELLCKRTENRLAGVLHFSQSKSQVEIRHLCVAEQYRRKGIATQLVKDFFAATEGKKAVVWTGSDNESAISLYKSCGFEPDNYKSFILLYKKGH